MVRMKRRWRNRDANYTLQLTAMVDMFTILLVFLLKSYTTSSVQMATVDDIQVPMSVSMNEPKEALRMHVSIKGVYVDDVKVLDLEEGKISSAEVDTKDKKFIKRIFDELDKHAKKSRDIASANTTHEFKGDLILQADQNLDYGLLKKIMYTSMLAGYANIKLGLMGME
jgi:biopolymer transport protein ExbD